ncbi:urease accessory protein UreF [Teredinibacter waterburyi]|uniref:urease accessory protein UreF n=1 Tax=Teredinibacter waterburyi TaxID=1500538 RepID=UPI00165F6E08|nr:urease accessory UreF family protein [Teredinibacter waterburyi]
MQNYRLLHLMHLVSPALPVGAYAYSQGQEYAVDAGWLVADGALEDWIAGILENSFAYLDLPLLKRFYCAWQAGDLVAVNYWNDYLRASRETHELLLEDEQLGVALQRLLVSLEIDGAENKCSAAPCFANLFALVGLRREIPLEDLMQGFAWSWLENQIAAATKAVPLGQTHAQKLITKLMVLIPPACDLALELPDEQLGVGLPGLSMASAKHERQYSRLFRS